MSVITFIIVLLLGSFLVALLRNFFSKEYSNYLSAAIAVTIVLFFLIRLPHFSLCAIMLSAWLLITLPFTPLGLCIALTLVAHLEGNRKLEDDKDGRKAQESRKKMRSWVTAAFLILLLSSMPMSADWLARQLDLSPPLVGRGSFESYIPSVRGLLATTDVLERAFRPLYYPFTVCRPPSN